MANYSLVINSQFQPFSFEEMLKPLAMETEAHQQLEANLSSLSSEAEKWAYLAQEAPDSKSAQIYNNYANDINAYINDLSSKGLNQYNRKGLWNMSRRYNSEIGELTKAGAKRDLAIKARKELDYKDNSMLHNDLPMDLDSYLYDNDVNPVNISGNLLQEKAAKIATAMSNRRTQFTDGRNVSEVFKQLSNQYFNIAKIKGYNSAEANAFLQNVANLPEMQEVINSIETSEGVGRLNTEGQLRARNYIVSGIFAGMAGDVDVKPIANGEYLNPLQRLQYNRAKREEEKEPPTIQRLLHKPLVGAKDHTELNDILTGLTTKRGIFSFKMDYNDFFNSEGKMLSEEEFNKKVDTDAKYRITSSGAFSPETPKMRLEADKKVFKEFKNTLKKYFNKTNFSKQELIDELNTLTQGNATAWTRNLPYMTLNQGDTENLLSSIKNNGFELRPVTYNPETKMYDTAGKKLKPSDIAKLYDTKKSDFKPTVNLLLDRDAADDTNPGSATPILQINGAYYQFPYQSSESKEVLKGIYNENKKRNQAIDELSKELKKLENQNSTSDLNYFDLAQRLKRLLDEKADSETIYTKKFFDLNTDLYKNEDIKL